ncbi:MAG TPA: phosphoglycerate kinase [Polyangiaceae bacterium]|nr:phosphoglycerate kinase [Polyangiaceae bacterium]
MNKLFIEDLDVAGKKVIVRVDFNVPLKDGVVENDKRLVESLPTIKYLIGKGAKVILMSHLGRPDGQVVESMRMAPVAQRLGELLEKPVQATRDCVGPEVAAAVAAMAAGDVLLLENLRFHAAEEANDASFAKELASLADVYVNDAFGTAHRAHASTAGITQHLSRCASGYLMKKELDFLGSALSSPVRPFVAIIGGAKISGKIDVIEALLPKVDKLLIGGGMAYTFFKAQGLEIGKSLVEADKIELAKSLLEKGGSKLMLPVDCRVSPEFDFKARTVGAVTEVAKDAIPADQMSLDIGPKTEAVFSEIVRGAKTVVWNGPMGVFEIDATAKGTMAIAQALADATQKNGAVTVIGGGDSASAIKKAGLNKKVSHVSTGGGASLEFLEGKVLPGVVALTDK